MKDLIIQALNETYEQCLNNVPETKVVPRYIDIELVDPCKLSDFIKKNNIPDNCTFDTNQSPDNFLEYPAPCLRYTVIVPMTENEKQKIIETRFKNRHFRIVTMLLCTNGFKRHSKGTLGYKNFEKAYGKKTVYQRYKEKDFTTLVTYFKLSHTLK